MNNNQNILNTIDNLNNDDIKKINESSFAELPKQQDLLKNSVENSVSVENSIKKSTGIPVETLTDSSQNLIEKSKEVISNEFNQKSVEPTTLIETSIEKSTENSIKELNAKNKKLKKENKLKTEKISKSKKEKDVEKKNISQTKSKKNKNAYLDNINYIKNNTKYKNEKFILWVKENFGQDCQNLLETQLEEKYLLFLEKENLKENKFNSVKSELKNSTKSNYSINIEDILTKEEYSQSKNNILENIKNLKIKSNYFKNCQIWQIQYFEYFKELSPLWQKDKEIIKAAIDVWGDLVINYFLQDKEKHKSCLKILLDNSEYNDYKNSIIYKLLSQNGLILKNKFLQENFNNHEKLVEIAISQNGLAIKYASANLKKNLNLAKIAIKQNAFAYNFIDNSLKTLPEIVELAINSNIQIIQPFFNGKSYKFHIKPELFQYNKNYFKKILSIQGNFLKYASNEIKNDVSCVLQAVSNNGLAIQYVSNDLQLNQKILYTAVAQNANSILYLDKYKNIIQSHELMNDLLKINGLILCHIPNPVKEFTLLAIKQNPYAIKYARIEQKNDKEIAKIVLIKKPTLIQFFPDNIQNDPEIIEFIIQNDKNNSAYHLLNQEILNNYENGKLINLALQNSINIFPYLPEKYKNNKNLILKACINDINNLNYANDELLIELAKIISQQLLKRNLIKDLQNTFFNSIENINFKSFNISNPTFNKNSQNINFREKLLNIHKNIFNN